MKRLLLFCDTTYQLYTILTIIFSSKESINADLIVKHGFSDSYKLIERIKEKNIFNKIYEYQVHDSDGSKLSKKIEDLKKLILSREWLKRHLVFAFDKYDRYYAANLDDNVALALYATTQFSEFYLFEDGTGSYHGNIIEDYMNWKRRGLLKFFHPCKRYFRIDGMLLFAPEISISTACSHYMKLESIEDDRLSDIFEYKENKLYENKIVFLDQSYALDRPNVITNQRKVQDELLRKRLNPFIEQVVLRPHPRMPEGSIDVPVVDTIRNFWEIECVRQIRECNILLSIYSSAAFQPAIVAHEFPTLVFLYRIYRFLYSEDQINQIEKHIERFTQQLGYTNVYVPNTWDEFSTVLSTCYQAK